MAKPLPAEGLLPYHNKDLARFKAHLVRRRKCGDGYALPLRAALRVLFLAWGLQRLGRWLLRRSQKGQLSAASSLPQPSYLQSLGLQARIHYFDLGYVATFAELRKLRPGAAALSLKGDSTAPPEAWLNKRQRERRRVHMEIVSELVAGVGALIAVIGVTIALLTLPVPWLVRMAEYKNEDQARQQTMSKRKLSVAMVVVGALLLGLSWLAYRVN